MIIIIAYGGDEDGGDCERDMMSLEEVSPHDDQWV